MNGDPRRVFEGLAAAWRWRRALESALRGLVLGLPVAALVSVALNGLAMRWWIAAGCAGGVSMVALTFGKINSSAVGAEQIARHLDRVAPQLEDSSALLLAAPEELPLLGRLQRERVAAALAGLDTDSVLPRQPLIGAARWATAALGVSALIAFGSGGAAPAATEEGTAASAHTEALPEDAPSNESAPTIEVTIAPPVYTGRPEHTVEGLDLSAEEGASLRWHVTLSGGNGPGADEDGDDKVELVFDERRRVALKPAGPNVFGGVATADGPHIYYLVVSNSGVERYRSPFARLRVIPDSVPDLRVVKPEPRVVLGPSDPLRLAVAVEAEDDYGLSEAVLVATLATGSGEMVKFRERRFAVPLRHRGGGKQSLTKNLDLAALGMQPGSDLYFHLEVADNREPEPNRTRTAAWIARMPGENTPTLAMGQGLPIVRLPEYFRSQRQIIIDTEKLIAESTVITRAEFERRAQSIGFDQRALRMRYGTILGEEFESGVPIDESTDHDAEANHADHADSPGAETLEEPSTEDEIDELLEGFVHQHDSVENATFFTTSIKQELRAALSAMWDAEGSLRIFAPDAALPAEHTALHHIKNVQEGARVYVLKVGFDPPPLDVKAKRLTGDLSKIGNQRDTAETVAKASAPEARAALDLLDVLRGGRLPPADESDRILANAARVLAERARVNSATGPDVLEALDALRRLREALPQGDAPATDDVDTITRELWRSLPQPERRPSIRRIDGGGLHDTYLRQLEDLRREGLQ